ncbi:MAG: DUF3887 domain-containing protein [Tissierellia bacterium]|nr:DUF3887 domain-containing protein [Tissierellia bacterium]
MKYIKFLIISILSMIILIGCSKGESHFDEEKAKEIAEKAVIYHIENNYDDFRDLCSEELKEVLSDDALKDLDEKIMDKVGDFEEIKEVKFTEKVDKKHGPLARVFVNAKFSESKLIYTVVLDEDYIISGFFVK